MSASVKSQRRVQLLASIATALVVATIAVVFWLNHSSQTASSRLVDRALREATAATSESSTEAGVVENLERLGYWRTDPEIYLRVESDTGEPTQEKLAFRKHTNDKYFNFVDGPHSKNVVITITKSRDAYQVEKVYIEIDGF